ncbi:MAG: hypothetical protein ACTHQM_20775 [Thermoanaerobaculia bacterium]
MKSIVRLGGARVVDDIAPMLLDDTSSVSSAACEMLRPFVALVDIDELFARAKTSHSRRRARTCEPSHCALEHELQPKPERAVARHRPRHALKVVRFATHAWA